MWEPGSAHQQSPDENTRLATNECVEKHPMLLVSKRLKTFCLYLNTPKMAPRIPTGPVGIRFCGFVESWVRRTPHEMLTSAPKMRHGQDLSLFFWEMRTPHLANKSRPTPRGIAEGCCPMWTSSYQGGCGKHPTEQNSRGVFGGHRACPFNRRRRAGAPY